MRPKGKKKVKKPKVPPSTVVPMGEDDKKAQSAVWRHGQDPIEVQYSIWLRNLAWKIATNLPFQIKDEPPYANLKAFHYGPRLRTCMAEGDWSINPSSSQMISSFPAFVFFTKLASRYVQRWRINSLLTHQKPSRKERSWTMTPQHMTACML